MGQLRFLAVAALGIVTAGCHGPQIVDSVDLAFDWSLLGDPNLLHLPYAAGTSFQLYTHGVDDEHTRGWYLESDAPAVLRIDDTADGDADVSALAAGEARVTLYDTDGRRRRTAVLDVRQPDGAALAAHGALIIDRPELQEEWDEIHVLAGGSATFEVTWYEGSTRLYGNGSLTAVATGDIVVEPRRTFLFEDREWVTFTPGSPGTYDVELHANGQLVRTVSIVAVSEDVIDGMELHGMNESGASSGELLTVLAQAYDVDGRPIFGVEYEWDLDGVLGDGFGDLFRYEYAPRSPSTLSARFAELEATATIHAEDGYVDSTSNLGCAVGSPGASTGAAWPILLGWLALRRRRSSRLSRPSDSG